MDKITIHPNDVNILVVNNHGYLKRIYLPFRVKCILAVGSIRVNEFVYVDGVAEHSVHLIAYFIHNEWHPYHAFQIRIP